MIDLKVRVIRQSDEIVEPDLDLYWAKASTALTVFRLLHEVGHFRQFSEILTHSWRIQPSTRQYVGVPRSECRQNWGIPAVEIRSMVTRWTPRSINNLPNALC